MELIAPSVEIIQESNAFKKVELAGRTCYKSEKAITDESALVFYKKLVSSHHVAMLEHAAFVFQVSQSVYEAAAKCHFLNCTHNDLFDRYVVSGNLRAINESGIAALIRALSRRNSELAYASINCSQCQEGAKLIDLVSLSHLSRDEFTAHTYTTMRFITDRGVSHEIVRHRLFSFAQESTRYVCYSKDKFGGGNIKFIKPANYDNWSDEGKMLLQQSLVNAEQSYNALVANGLTAQQARAVLPNAIKTEILVTGNDREWQHFFNLRSVGTTGTPHPDIKIVADEAKRLYWQVNPLSTIYYQEGSK